MPQLDELPIKSPESPVLNEGRGRIKGRNVDCFSSGALYIYLGTTDAIPIHSLEASYINVQGFMKNAKRPVAEMIFMKKR